MKNINPLYFILLFLAIPIEKISNPTITTIIFAPTPLFELSKKNNASNNYIKSFKQAIAPLTVCFYYTIHETNIWTDAIQNPYATTVLICMVAYYSKLLMVKNKQNKIDKELIEIMQHIFHVLIISHGIYNEITAPTCCQDKAATTINSFTLTTLQLFLNKAHEIWFTLSTYYQEHYKCNYLYAYHMDQVDVFEIIQASTYEPDIFPLITNFYDKNNKIYDYEPILDCLEIKLKKINHKLIKVLPAEYHKND